MVSLTNELISYLQGYSFDVAVPTENIIEAYSVDTPNYDNPYITVEEITNLPNMETYTNKEEYSIIGYQIEVYTTQQEVKGTVLSARDTCKSLLDQITEAVCKQFNLIRTASPTILPVSQDASIQRGILRCEANIDRTHKYLYRR